jgi:hypothetical protein
MYTILYWLNDVLPTIAEPHKDDQKTTFDAERSVEAYGGTGSPGSVEASTSDDLDDDYMSNLTHPHANTMDLKLEDCINLNTLLIVKLHNLKEQMSSCTHCNPFLEQINIATRSLHNESI